MSPEITTVETHVVETSRKLLIFVELHTDTGEIGLGEAASNASAESVIAAVDAARDHVVGMNPFATEQLFERLFNVSVLTPPAVSAGPNDVVHTSAASAIDIACWDIKAKQCDVPLYELLGGPVREQIPTYANGWWQDVYRIEDGDADALAAAAERVVADGYTALKFNPFGRGPGWLDRQSIETTVERVAAVREAIGPTIDLLVEGHRQLTPSTARDVASRLAAYDPALFEEPTPPKASELTQVTKRTDVPVATGETLITHHAFGGVLDAGVGVVQPDPLRTGGVTETRKIAAMADAAGASMAPHNACGPVGTAVSAHLGASTPNFTLLETFDEYAYPEWVPELLSEAVTVTDGVATVPEGPGLGVTLDADVVDAHRV